MESFTLDSRNKKDFTNLQTIFKQKSLQIASFTITEKGYSLVNGQGETLPDVKRDFKNGPKQPESYMGKVTALLYTRYLNGKHPIALVSMDNCSHNGDKLYAAVRSFAEQWEKNGAAESGSKLCKIV